MNITRLIEMITDAYAKSTGFEYTITNKGHSDFVTSTDISIEQYLINQLSTLFPEYGIISEEALGSKKDKYWVIDPIDGTTNFIRGLYHTVSLALVEKNETIVGIVYDPLCDAVYYAQKGRGAYKLSGKKSKRIVLDRPVDTNNIMLAFGMPYDKSKLSKMFYYAEQAMHKASDVKRIGPSSRDICMVAEGFIDCYFELDLKEWDTCAAGLILDEAGGVYVRTDDLFVASNPNAKSMVDYLIQMAKEYDKRKK